MNAQKLAYRIAMCSLIEPEMEALQPDSDSMIPGPFYDRTPGLLSDDPSELDKLQEAEELEFERLHAERRNRAAIRQTIREERLGE